MSGVQTFGIRLFPFGKKKIDIMITFLKTHKTEIIIFCIALIVRLVVFGGILWQEALVGDFDGRQDAVPILGGDATEYFYLGRNLLHYRVFSLEPDEPFQTPQGAPQIGKPGLFPESFRTPGYPAFVALFYGATRSLFVVSAIQMLLSAFSVVLLYAIAKRFLSEQASRISAGLFAIEPSSVFYSGIILSDTVFVFLLLAVIWIFLNHKDNPAYWKMLCAGIALGFATLARPVAQFLPVLFAGLLFFQFRIFSKYLWKYIGYFFVGFLLIVFPWMARNYYYFQSWQLSSVSAITAYVYNVPMFYAAERGLNQDEVIEFFKSRYGEFNLRDRSLLNVKEMQQSAVAIIKTNPVGYAKFHLLKTIPFFLTDGIRDPLRLIRLLKGGEPNLSSLLASGNIREIMRLIFSGEPNFNFFLVGFAFWSAISLGFFASIIFAWKRQDRSWLWFFALLVFYFAILTGPVSSGRYRMPAVPFLLLLACFGFAQLASYIPFFQKRFF